jgi:hypothetical protein
MEQVSQYKVAFLQRSVPYTLTLLAPPGRAEDRLHQRGVLAELRRLDEAEQAHQGHPQRRADLHRQVPAV